MLQHRREGFSSSRKINQAEKNATPSGIFLCETPSLGVDKTWLAFVNEHDRVSEDRKIR